MLVSYILRPLNWFQRNKRDNHLVVSLVGG